MTRRISIVTATSFATMLAAATLGIGQEKPKLGYKDTPILPGGKWHVHDGDRPQPPIVTPGTASTQDQPGTAPSDAVVLFDGKDLSHWHDGKGGPAKWTIGEGGMVVAPGTGDSMAFSRLTSTMIPSPIAPPAMLLPDPRGISGRRSAAAHVTSVTTSSPSAGMATARGMTCAMPAASL